jgi:acetyl-CoA carboxylase biotin carboxyl carrier protein
MRLFYMSNDIFDLKRIKRLVELMQVNDLTELDIQQGDLRVQLKRNNLVAAPVPNRPTVTQTVHVPQIAAVPVQPSPPVDDGFAIKSPMVGTFYTSSSPDSPPFVKIGDTVTPDKTVCLVEAMKVYNEIQAECSGKITAILVKNGDTVEYGTPLFRVLPE